MHRLLVTTYAMLGHVQAPPPPSPPPPPSLPVDIPEDLDDLYFGDDDEELEVTHEAAAMAAEEEEVEEDEVEVEEEDEAEDIDDDLAFLDDLPDPEEKAAEQRGLLASYESAKKADDVARAWHRPRRRSSAARSSSPSSGRR
jgi:hypothetical protein